MSLLYVTGPPGSGKSAVQKELTSLGYVAYDIDDSRFGGPVHKHTGKPTTVPPVENRSADWFEQHEWRISRSAIEGLKAASATANIYLCGTASTEKSVWDLFDKVFYLNVDEATLRFRLQNRKGNDFGKTESELESILEQYRTAQQGPANQDVTPIDATQDISSLVKQIIELS